MEIRAGRFLADVRGDEPTHVLSARLGYRGDPIADWEAGRRWPTASETLRVCAARRIDVGAALRAFDPTSAAEAGTLDDAGLAAWCRAVCTGRDARSLARDLGRPTATVRRWLGGQVRPTLPEWLGLIEVATGRAEDLLQCLVPLPEPDATPAGRAAKRRGAEGRRRVAAALDAARSARGTPSPPPERLRVAPSPPVPVEVEPEWSDADDTTVEVFADSGTGEVTEVTDLQVAPVVDETGERVWRAVAGADHQALGPERPGWLAARAGLPQDAVDACLQRLAGLGAIAWDEDRWRALIHPPQADEAAVVTGDPLAVLARSRADQIVVSLAEADVPRVRALRRCTAAELAAIEAASAPKARLLLVRADP